MRPGEFKPYYIYRFLLWKLGNKSPLSAVAKITNKCNLKYKHCPWWKRDIEDASTEEWFKILRWARKQGVIHLILEGGEPTIRSDLDELISYAKNLGMLVMVITNGLTDLSEHEPDSYWISFEGIGKTHDENRGAGVFNKVIENIKKNQEYNIVAGVTITKHNKDQIEEISSFFSSITNGVWFNFMYPYQDVDDIALIPSEQRKVAQKIIKLKKDYNIISSYPYLKSVGKSEKKCPSFLTLLIDSDISVHKGCTVELKEECRCEVCNLGCYGELAQAMRLKLDAINFLKKTAGVNTHRLFWLK